MIESCAIAYLKEFLYAFMLYLIPRLTYDANSVIFTFKMKSPIATNFPRKFSFQRVQGDLDCEEARFQVANRDLTGFYQRVLLATKKAIWGSFIKMPSNASSRALTGIGLTGIGQTEEDQHTAVTPVNIKCLGNYLTADLSSICTASHNVNLSYSL